MTTTQSSPNAAEADLTRRDWGLALGAGIAMILLSLFMFVYPAAFGLAITVIIGWVILAAGVIQIVAGIAHRNEGGLWGNLILGVISLAAGFLLAFRPLAGTVTLATLFCLWLIADGLVGTILTLVRRGPDWGWWLVSSLLSLILGIVLFGTLPVGSFWIIGTFAAITLLFRGLILSVVSIEMRRRTRAAV